MTRIATNWNFTFEFGGSISISATMDGVEDAGDGQIFDGVPERFKTHPNDYPDAAALGLVLEPKVEKIAPGVFTAQQLTDFCRGIAEIQWQFYEAPIEDPIPDP